jgi:DNA-binding transcriptional regulator YdaS (Cro superfamily)
MKLNEYLASIQCDERKRVAKECGTSVDYLYQLAGKHRNAGHALTRKIEKATGKAVTKEELRPDIFGDDAA